MLMASWSRVAYGHSVRSARSVGMVGRSRVGPQSTHGHGIWGLCEDLVPVAWLHGPTLPADILFHWDSYQKNSSILEKCIILIYYVVELGSFKV